MLNAAFGWLYDRLVGHRGLVLAVSAVVLAAASVGALGIGFDMSFRPLFADHDENYQVTKKFERTFGQESGAHVVAIIENPNILTPGFLRQLDHLSRDVARVPHVSEVISLATAPRLTWQDGRPTQGPLLPTELLAQPRLPSAVADALRRDPQLRGTLIAKDAKSTLLLARLNLPLDDLAGREPAIHAFTRLVHRDAPTGSTVRVTGVSVVEAAYARILLVSLVKSIVIPVTVILGILWLYFRRVRAVLTCMVGVTAAIPVTLWVLRLIGQQITIVNSQVLTMVLIIGVTHAIHMQEGFYRQRERGLDTSPAVRSMFIDLALPGIMTTVVTMLGFLSLRTASIQAIRDFSLSVSVGIAIVYVTNLVLIPLVQERFLRGEQRARGRATVTVTILRAVSRAARSRPGVTAGAFIVLVAVAAAWGIPRLNADQRFNEELRPSNPVRVNEATLERQYSGFLGPDLALTRADGKNLLDPTDLHAVRSLANELRRMPHVLRVFSVTDYFPQELTGDQARAAVSELTRSGPLRKTLQGLVTPSGDRLALLVRTTDMGTNEAKHFVTRISTIGRAQLGHRVHLAVVGQWALAQRGMQHLMNDMLKSTLTAGVFILPILALTLRRFRLFLCSILPSAAPVVIALAFMGAAGIKLRIGTAMILAIALGLVVDDTIHLLLRFRRGEDDGTPPDQVVHRTLMVTGRPCSFSSYVLVFGFATMATSELHAVRDMGIVAAITMLVALAADLLLDPTQYLLTRPRAPVPAATPETVPATPELAIMKPHLS
jgi:uncharacterized protein